MLIEGSIYQSPLCLSQRNHIGTVGLELLTALTEVLRQFVYLNLMAQQIVEEEMGDALILGIAKHDVALAAHGDGALEELLLMTQEHGLLIGTGLQRTNGTTGMVTQVLGKFVNA